ncbi:MAG TPA: glycosyltransferase [Candidatus Paceibacterota bacterium]|nr:glycosyltransferase [Candidatus Paceibacterota bacterium]
MQGEISQKEKIPYRIVMITEDQSIFADSPAQKRIKAYGAVVEELYVIVLSRKNSGFAEKRLAENIWVYPTNSKHMFYAVSDAARTVKLAIRAKKVHLMVCENPFRAGLAGWFVSRETGTPFEIQIPDDVFSPVFRSENLKNLACFYLAKFLLPKAQSIRAFSKRVKDSLYENLHFEVGHIPYMYTLAPFVDVLAIRNFVPQKSLEEKYSEFVKIILIVSRFEKEKNVLLSIAALRMALSGNPNWGVVIVGGGSREKFLKKKVRKFGLISRIAFEPWTNKEDLISYFKTASLFLSTANQSGFGKNLFMAAVSGCPTVTTEVGVVGAELSKEHLAVCDPKDATCVYTRLSQMMNDSFSLSQLEGHAQILARDLPAVSADEHFAEVAAHWKKVILAHPEAFSPTENPSESF